MISFELNATDTVKASSALYPWWTCILVPPTA